MPSKVRALGTSTGIQAQCYQRKVDSFFVLRSNPTLKVCAKENISILFDSRDPGAATILSSSMTQAWFSIEYLDLASLVMFPVTRLIL